MTLRDFSRLSEAGKDEMIVLWSDYLKESIVPGHRVMLYKLDDFYVEVYFDFKEEKVKKYKGCLRSDMLQH